MRIDTYFKHQFIGHCPRYDDEFIGFRFKPAQLKTLPLEDLYCEKSELNKYKIKKANQEKLRVKELKSSISNYKKSVGVRVKNLINLGKEFKIKKEEARSTIERVAEYLMKSFSEEGFDIHYLESVTTNSFYIKLNYGAAYTIRISDHTGKSYLTYRYNLRLDLKGKKKEVHEGIVQFYFGYNCIEDLIIQVLTDYLINTESEEVYKAYNKRYLEGVTKFNEKSKGFWAKCSVYNN